jgi:prepilin peptidase CpaA
MNLFQIIAIGVSVAAVAWDVTTRRIPNALTFGAEIAAVAVHVYFEGWAGIGPSLAGWLVGAALFFPFFALGGMGAGDVKLLAAVGAWIGPLADPIVSRRLSTSSQRLLSPARARAWL